MTMTAIVEVIQDLPLIDIFCFVVDVGFLNVFQSEKCLSKIFIYYSEVTLCHIDGNADVLEQVDSQYLAIQKRILFDLNNLSNFWNLD